MERSEFKKATNTNFWRTQDTGGRREANGRRMEMRGGETGGMG